MIESGKLAKHSTQKFTGFDKFYSVDALQEKAKIIAELKRRVE